MSKNDAFKKSKLRGQYNTFTKKNYKFTRQEIVIWKFVRNEV